MMVLAEETYASHHGRRPNGSCNTTPLLFLILKLPSFSTEDATEDAECLPSPHEVLVILWPDAYGLKQHVAI